jgi:hypothetical protein
MRFGLAGVGRHTVCHTADGQNMFGKILLQVGCQQPGLVLHGSMDLVPVLLPEPRPEAGTHSDKDQQNGEG